MTHPPNPLKLTSTNYYESKDSTNPAPKPAIADIDQQVTQLFQKRIEELQGEGFFARVFSESLTVDSRKIAKDIEKIDIYEYQIIVTRRGEAPKTFDVEKTTQTHNKEFLDKLHELYAKRVERAPLVPPRAASPRVAPDLAARARALEARFEELTARYQSEVNHLHENLREAHDTITQLQAQAASESPVSVISTPTPPPDLTLDLQRLGQELVETKAELVTLTEEKNRLEAQFAAASSKKDTETKRALEALASKYKEFEASINSSLTKLQAELDSTRSRLEGQITTLHAAHQAQLAAATGTISALEAQIATLEANHAAAIASLQAASEEERKAKEQFAQEKAELERQLNAHLDRIKELPKKDELVAMTSRVKEDLDTLKAKQAELKESARVVSGTRSSAAAVTGVGKVQEKLRERDAEYRTKLAHAQDIIDRLADLTLSSTLSELELATLRETLSASQRMVTALEEEKSALTAQSSAALEQLSRAKEEKEQALIALQETLDAAYAQRLNALQAQLDATESNFSVSIAALVAACEKPLAEAQNTITGLIAEIETRQASRQAEIDTLREEFERDKTALSANFASQVAILEAAFKERAGSTQEEHLMAGEDFASSLRELEERHAKELASKQAAYETAKSALEKAFAEREAELLDQIAKQEKKLAVIEKEKSSLLTTSFAQISIAPSPHPLEDSLKEAKALTTTLQNTTAANKARISELEAKIASLPENAAEQIAALSQQLTALTTENDRLSALISNKETTRSKEENILCLLALKIWALQARLASLQEELAQEKERSKVLETAGVAKESLSSLQERIATLQAQEASLRAAIEDQQSALQALGAAHRDLETTTASLTLQKAELSSAIETLRAANTPDKIRPLQVKIAGIEKELETLKNARERLISLLNAELAVPSALGITPEEELSNLLQAIKMLKGEKDTLVDTLDQLYKEVAEERHLKDTALSDVARVSDELAALRSAKGRGEDLAEAEMQKLMRRALAAEAKLSDFANLTLELARQQAENGDLKRANAALEEAIKRVTEQFTELAPELKNLQGEIATLRAQLVEKDRALADALAQIGALTADKETSLAEKQREIADLEARLRDTHAAIDKRITDVLAASSGEIASLTRQLAVEKDKAQKTPLLTAEIAQLRAQLKMKTDEIDSSSAASLSAAEKATSLTQQLSALQDALSAERARTVALQTALSEKDPVLDSLSAALSEKERELVAAGLKIAQLNEANERVAAELDTEKGKALALRSKLIQKTAASTELEGAIAPLREGLAAYEETLRKQDREILSLHAQLGMNNEQLKALYKEITGVDYKEGRGKNLIAELSTIAVTLSRENEAQRAKLFEIDTLKAQNARLMEHLDSASREKAAAMAAKEAAERTLRAKQTELVEINRELTQLKTKIQSLYDKYHLSSFTDTLVGALYGSVAERQLAAIEKYIDSQLAKVTELNKQNDALQAKLAKATDALSSTKTATSGLLARAAATLMPSRTPSTAEASRGTVVLNPLARSTSASGLSVVSDAAREEKNPAFGKVPSSTSTSAAAGPVINPLHGKVPASAPPSSAKEHVISNPAFGRHRVPVVTARRGIVAETIPLPGKAPAEASAIAAAGAGVSIVDKSAAEAAILKEQLAQAHGEIGQLRHFIDELTAKLNEAETIASAHAAAAASAAEEARRGISGERAAAMSALSEASTRASAAEVKLATLSEQYAVRGAENQALTLQLTALNAQLARSRLLEATSAEKDTTIAKLAAQMEKLETELRELRALDLHEKPVTKLDEFDQWLIGSLMTLNNLNETEARKRLEELKRGYSGLHKNLYKILMTASIIRTTRHFRRLDPALKKELLKILNDKYVGGAFTERGGGGVKQREVISALMGSKASSHLCTGDGLLLLSYDLIDKIISTADRPEKLEEYVTAINASSDRIEDSLRNKLIGFCLTLMNIDKSLGSLSRDALAGEIVADATGKAITQLIKALKEDLES